MKKVIIIIGLIAIHTFNTFSQNPNQSLTDFGNCLTSIFIIGTETGYWDTSIINSEVEQSCDDFFSSREFNISGDTLFIVENKYLQSDRFIGIKAVLKCDKKVISYFFLEDFISVKDKKRKTKNKINDDSLEPIVIEFTNEGKTHSIKFSNGECH